MKREPPKWRQEDRDWYRLDPKKPLDVCMICGKTMEIGDPYWLNAATWMIAEPPRVFHDACKGKRPSQAITDSPESAHD